jgi:cytoskeleton protein RodZ
MMSTATPLTAKTPEATRAGADLRAARERLGWSLSDIAADLRIRLCHLEALEQGHVSMLPANAYAVAYVRAYARALGLDPEQMVRRFKAEAAEVGRRTELAFPVPVPDRGLPAGAVVLLGLVLSIGTYAGWYRLSGDGHLPAETVTAIPERLAPLAEQALPMPMSSLSDRPTGSKQIAAANTRAKAAPQIAPAEPAPPVSQISPTSAAAALVHEPVLDEVMAPTTSTGATNAPGSDDSRIVLRANADAWIQVKDRSGTILLNRTMRAGELWPVPRQENLLLTTGNAGGTEILLDGASTPSLGPSGAVRRDVPLDPDLIKDGKLATTQAPPLAAAHARQ